MGTADSKQKTAAELYNRSLNESEPAMELASLHLAAKLVVEASDFSRAMEICNRMGERFEIDVLPVKADFTFASCGVRAYPQKIRPTSPNYAWRQVFRRSPLTILHGQDNCRTGQICCTNPGDEPHWQAGFLAEETARCAAAYRPRKTGCRHLNTNPDDPAANLAMGKFLCFIKNDWAAGFPLLVRGSDELSDPGNQETTSARKSPSEQVALGDAWWKLSVAAPDMTMAFISSVPVIGI